MNSVISQGMYRAIKIAVMLAVAASFLGLSACEHMTRILTDDGDDDMVSSDEYVIKDLPIVDVLGVILESYPPQIHLLVTGQLTDSCTTLHETTESRQDNKIRIHMTTKRPIDMVCATVVTEIEHVVPLGYFDPGKYEIIVNGFAITVDVD